MSEVHRVIRAAALRLSVSRFLTYFVMLLSVAILFAIGARLAQQLFTVGIDWKKLAWLAPSVAAAAALIATFIRRDKALTVAQKVDEGGDLKESLSTALCIQGATDPWSANVQETARRAAIGVRVGQAVPIRVPRTWPTPLALGLALVVMWIVIPPMDLLGRGKLVEKQKIEAEKVETTKAEVKTAVEQAKKKVDEAMKNLGEKEDENLKAPNPEKPTTPEEIRRAAIKQLTSMKDKLDAMKLGQKSMNADAMMDKMKQLRTPGAGPLEQFAQAMAQGKMGEAQQALSDLGKSMSSGSMSPEQAAQTKKQLDNLAKQLDKIAGDKKKLEQQLAKAGLDPKLASTPSALAEALKKNENLSQEQKDQMQKQANAQESASQNCQGMASAMSKMAEAMKNGEMGQQGAQAMQQMQDAMSQMEMAQADAQSLEAAQSECQNALNQMGEGMGQCNNPGEGECKGGQCNGNGNPDSNGAYKTGESQHMGGMGRGGPGISQGGGGMGEQQAPENWTKRKAKTALGGGPMIGTMLVQGEQIKGESRQAMADMTAAAAQQATEAMNQNQIPREYQGVVKKYFSTLTETTKTDPAKPTPAAPAAPATPATPPAKP
jgi:hypothetical protein